MDRHDAIVYEQWARLLKRDDIAGGELHFWHGGDYIGHIEGTRDMGTEVRFYFEWAACKTTRGLVARKSIKHHDVTKLRISDAKVNEPITTGDVKIYPKGMNPTNPNKILPPAQSGKRERKKPLPLFEGLGN